MKTVHTLEIEGNPLNLIIITTRKATANITISGKRLDARCFLLILETRQGCPLPALIFNITLEVLVSKIR